MRHLVHRALAVTAVITASLALTAAAEASITPSISLNQSAGKAAGSSTNLGLDLKFADTGTDSPHNLTINLPPGLLANASINGGSCLKTTNTSGNACEVGSGTVTATPDILVLGLPASIPVPVTFYLVPPPKAGDLAGLTVIGNVLGLSEQLGSTGDIRVRPTGDPDGVGVTISLALPNQLALSGFTLPLVTISLTEIDSTFNRLRYPATCPATPARLTASADSYGDPTVHAVSAPLSVIGCSALAYAPAFRVTATRDSGDRQVRLATTVTQSATQAPSRSVSLAFPAATLAPNLASIRALCLNLGSGTCQTVGSATATSPLYPSSLAGTAYLTGSASGLSLTLVFPSPFPLTLTGAVDLASNAATFTGLPDIPLTNLGVTLNGGPEGLFLSTCNTPSGTADATLTDQNGDKTLTVPDAFSVAGCPGTGGASGGSGSTGGGGSTGSSGGSPNGSSVTGVTVGRTNISRGRFSGLAAGHPALSFRMRTTRGAPKLRALTVMLPSGLSFVISHHRVSGVSLGGAKIKSLVLAGRRLTINLRSAVPSLSVTLAHRSLKESAAIRRAARAHRLRSLGLTVIARNTEGTGTTFRVSIKSLGL
ncbi:MAG: hypothetical protein WAU75_25035 [Solirubrobacteraceae bacterium]